MKLETLNQTTPSPQGSGKLVSHKTDNGKTLKINISCEKLFLKKTKRISIKVTMEICSQNRSEAWAAI